MGNFLLSFLVGAGISAYVMFKWHKRVFEKIEFPIDSTMSFALFDPEGNQLTNRALVSIGSVGANIRPIVAEVVRTGPVHHGVIYMGEYGTVVETSGAPYVKAGDSYIIPPGAWQTDVLGNPDEPPL